MTARPSERHTGPAAAQSWRGHTWHIAESDRGTGRYWHTAVCEDCPWTGTTVQRRDAAAFQGYDHHAATLPTNPLIMPDPIRPTEPAEQPALF